MWRQYKVLNLCVRRLTRLTHVGSDSLAARFSHLCLSVCLLCHGEQSPLPGRRARRDARVELNTVIYILYDRTRYNNLNKPKTIPISTRQNHLRLYMHTPEDTGNHTVPGSLARTMVTHNIGSPTATILGCGLIKCLHRLPSLPCARRPERRPGCPFTAPGALASPTHKI